MTPNETEGITKEASSAACGWIVTVDIEEEEARETEEVMKEKDGAKQEEAQGLAEMVLAYWIEKYGSVPPRGGRPLTPNEKEGITKELTEREARWMEEVTREKGEAMKEKDEARMLKAVEKPEGHVASGGTPTRRARARRPCPKRRQV